MSHIKIIYYHDIAKSSKEKKAPKCYSPTVQQFREQMQFLRSHWNIVSLEQIAHYCKTGKFPKQPSVALTFDDGLAGVMLAAEELQDMNIPATVFVSTRFIDTHELPWFIHLDDILLETEHCGGTLVINDRKHQLNSTDQRAMFRRLAKKLLLQEKYSRQMQILSEWAETLGVKLGEHRKSEQTFLTWKQIKKLANNGIRFASHTHSHIDLCVLNDSELEEEFAKPVKLLEEKVGREHARFVGYPGGYFDRRVISVAKKYHKIGFATMASPRPSWKDIFRLPRRCVFAGGVSKLEYALSWRMMFDSRLKHHVKSMFRIP